MKKRYVITGASGHIGNNVVREILKKEKSAEVILLNRRKLNREVEGLNVIQSIGDMRDKSFFENNIKKGDIVIHLAGFIDLNDKDYQTSYDINYLMTKNIADVCMSNSVAKFVYIGTVDAIFREGNGEISEPEDYFPDKLKDNYGKTKAMASKYVLDLIKFSPKFPAVIILPTAVIGVNDFKPSAVGKVIKDTLNGKVQFGLIGGYNFVDVTDVASAIVNACNKDVRGQYIISGHNVTVKEVYDKINKYKGWNKHPIILPNWLVNLAIPFVKVLSKVTVEALRSPHNYTCSKANKDLGYTPKDIDETMLDTIKWFEEYYNKLK